LFFVTRGYVWTIPVSSWKHFDSKTLLCIIIGDDNVSIRLVLFFGGFFWITAFLKYSYSEVRICTVYGAIWLERQAAWVEFHSETWLGRFAAAEVFVGRFLREGRRFQVQLLPRGVAFRRQLQLLRGRLQLPEGDFCLSILSSAMSVRPCSAHSCN
jgi:hypothetical protein